MRRCSALVLCRGLTFEGGADGELRNGRTKVEALAESCEHGWIPAARALFLVVSISGTCACGSMHRVIKSWRLARPDGLRFGASGLPHAYSRI